MRNPGSIPASQNPGEHRAGLSSCRGSPHAQHPIALGGHFPPAIGAGNIGQALVEMTASSKAFPREMALPMTKTSGRSQLVDGEALDDRTPESRNRSLIGDRRWHRSRRRVPGGPGELGDAPMKVPQMPRM